MAAKIFEIIAIVLIIIFGLVFAFALRFVAKFLKRNNKTMGSRAGEMRRQFDSSIGGMDNAQVQIESMAAVSSSVRAGMTSAISATARAVAFLESRAFQIGLPAVLWFLLLAIALPRGLRVRRAKRGEVRIIPPPSWEAAAAKARAAE